MYIFCFCIYLKTYLRLLLLSIMFLSHKYAYRFKKVIRGVLKESVTKTSHNDGEETTASESVAFLSGSDFEGDSIHTLEQSFTVSQSICFSFQSQIQLYEVLYRVYQKKGNRTLSCSSAPYLIQKTNSFTV